MKSNNDIRVSTTKIYTILVIAILCFIAGISSSCRDEFYYGKNDSKKIFAIPNQNELDIVKIGDSVTGFLYSDFQYKYYKVHNSGKDFQINIEDYKNKYDDKYCLTTVMTTYSEKSTYGTTITRNGNAYKISSSSEYTNVTVTTTGSETTGYFAFKFTEIACDEIIINNPAKTFYYDPYNSSYSKKIQINGVANKDYRFYFTSDYSANYSIVNSSGMTILSSTGNFTFPSDGKPCYIVVTSYSNASFTASIVELTDGKTEAISIYPTRNTTNVNATVYHSNDNYPSQWYKFYGTPGEVYVIQSTTLFGFYSFNITSPNGLSFSKVGQKFTMPNEAFVYIKMSYTYGSTYYSSCYFYIYPETTVQANAITLSLNQTNTISLYSSDYLVYDEIYGNSINNYIRWYKFSALAGKKYTFTLNSFSSSYAPMVDIYSGMSSVASINYNNVVSYTSPSTKTLYLKIESYYSSTINFTSKEE